MVEQTNVLIPRYPISYLTIASSVFFRGRLRVPTRRCDLVVPADGGWGRSNEFTWSFEPYVEFVPFSTRVLGSKGSAVGRGIGPLPNRPPDRRLPIVGRSPPGTRALDILSARGLCRGFSRFALCEEHWAHFWRPRNCNICYYGVRSRSTSNKSN
jgi:hypothetical protein